MNAASRSRRVRFPLPDRIDTSWNPEFPEFAAAANAVSLLMPHVEPYVVRSVASVPDQLDEELRTEAETFVSQELGHQGQHLRINRRLMAGCPSLGRVDSVAARCYRHLARRWSTRWSLAFAAGFETSAFALARWSEAHLRTLFGAADEQITTVYLWHLAEEVEHKSVAFDVYARIDGSRWRYLIAGVVSLVLLATLTTAGTLVQLAASRRIWNPLAWWRLLRWSISLAFEVLPDLFVAAMPGHHPSQFSDPSLLVTWLQGFDPATARNPHWSARAA